MDRSANNSANVIACHCDRHETTVVVRSSWLGLLAACRTATQPESCRLRVESLVFFWRLFSLVFCLLFGHRLCSRLPVLPRRLRLRTRAHIDPPRRDRPVDASSGQASLGTTRVDAFQGGRGWTGGVDRRKNGRQR
ncbi:unnamed protein product [Protopolystoma xenopodis]|uniref:Uncharacterized protein n=1 Tax=Protopolystoma xenopodis TaxID=117903 RepID=A0A3S5A5S7_9PLAT|nr:unnamed protein product [Protopolystoma xenopodis]